MKAKLVNSQPYDPPLLCLFNSGNTGSLHNKQSLPFGTKPNTTPLKSIQTAQGTHTSNQIVLINNIQLPEFVNSRKKEGIIAHVFDSSGYPYDVILGQDFLQTIGIRMNFQLDFI